MHTASGHATRASLRLARGRLQLLEKEACQLDSNCRGAQGEWQQVPVCSLLQKRHWTEDNVVAFAGQLILNGILFGATEEVLQQQCPELLLALLFLHSNLQVLPHQKVHLIDQRATNPLLEGNSCPATVCDTIELT